MTSPTEAIPAPITLGEEQLGVGSPCHLMAVVGSSHNGKKNLARRHIEAAAEAGWNSISFQPKLPDLNHDGGGLDEPTYREHCELHGLNPSDPTAYWKYHNRPDRLFDPEWHSELAEFAHEEGLAYIPGFYSEAELPYLEQLARQGLLDGLVIDQLEHGDPLLLERAASLGVPLVISAACKTPGSVERAIEVCQEAEIECVILQSSGGQPAPPDQVDLGLIGRINQETSADLAPVNTGYSNHTVGHIVIPAANGAPAVVHDPVEEARQAVQYGAVLYKAQITLNDEEFESAGVRGNAPPGLRRALIPAEQSATRQAVRDLEVRTQLRGGTAVSEVFPPDRSRDLGHSLDETQPCEEKVAKLARVVVPLTEIAQNSELTTTNCTSRRGGTHRGGNDRYFLAASEFRPGIVATSTLRAGTPARSRAVRQASPPSSSSTAKRTGVDVRDAHDRSRRVDRGSVGRT